MNGLVVVVNPAAGRGRAREVWEALRESEPRLAAAPVVAAADPEAARKELGALLGPGVDRLVVLGGDGTVHLVGNLVLERGFGAQVAIGLVPTGTGSDLAHCLGVPTEPRQALQRALDSAPRPLDALRLETDDGRRRFVLNVFSAGISGLVDQEMAALSHRGASAYARATLRTLARYRPVPCRIRLDGAAWYEGEILVAAVANGERFGRGMRIAPGARLDDGEADVVVVGPVARWQVPFRLPQIYHGTHLGSRLVRAKRARAVRLEPLAPIPPFDLDGESFASAPADIRVLPGALRICC